MGMAEARRLVFERALDDFHARTSLIPSKIIVDGTIFRQWKGVEYECVEKADALFPCVSAASILAKTSRDMQVIEWCAQDPTLDVKYGIKNNKGYLSKQHIEGLRQHGYSDLHRRSYHIRALHP